MNNEQVEGALALLERCTDRKTNLEITGMGKSDIELLHLFAGPVRRAV
jgi:hypothetical protein|tara:strand:+ start:1577 stop:1720 length:144 start_codon:yes stop_codon:yes gene_type:complete